MECGQCHTPLPDGSRFCFACGADQTGGGGPAPTEIDALQQRLQRTVQGKYEVTQLLGKGGMGAVFLANDLTLEREVAIKVLPPEISLDPKIVQRFQQEAKMAARLDHPNIIPVYRVESEGGLNYFVMKYIVGTSLEDVLDHRKSVLPVDYTQRVLWEAACALGHAHQRSIVHRDVKPANIMFDHDGKVMLTDFGISKALQAASGFTGTGMIIGTPHYMAPEQAKGQTVDGRADQYALAVVGYRMLTGRLPFSGDSVHSILYKHIFEEPPPPREARDDLPEFLAVAVQRALSKDPAQRYATMEEFATAVWPEQPVSAGQSGPHTLRARSKPAISSEMPTEKFASVATTSGRRPGPRPRRAQSSRAGRWVGTLLVLAAGVGGGYVLLERGAFGGGDAGAPTPSAASPAAPRPAPPVVMDVRVAPSTVQLRPGGGAALTASPVDGRGQRVANAAVAWTSSAPQVARVDSAGLVTAVAPGLAMIEARAGAARGQAAIQVIAPQAATPQPPPRSGAQRAPAAEEWGFLSINTTPAATVFVNGVEAGETPLGNYRVRPGAVTLRVEAPGYRTVTERVTVEAGATVRKTWNLIPEG